MADPWVATLKPCKNNIKVRKFVLMNFMFPKQGHKLSINMSPVSANMTSWRHLCLALECSCTAWCLSMQNMMSVSADQIRKVQLYTASYRIIQLHTASYSFIQLHTASYSFIQLHTASYSFIQLHTASYGFIQLYIIHFHISSYISYTCIQLHTASLSFLQIHALSYSFMQFHLASYTSNSFI